MRRRPQSVSGAARVALFEEAERLMKPGIWRRPVLVCGGEAPGWLHARGERLEIDMTVRTPHKIVRMTCTRRDADLNLRASKPVRREAGENHRVAEVRDPTNMASCGQAAVRRPQIAHEFDPERASWRKPMDPRRHEQPGWTALRDGKCPNARVCPDLEPVLSIVVYPKRLNDDLRLFNQPGSSSGDSTDHDQKPASKNQPYSEPRNVWNSTNQSRETIAPDHP